MMRGVEDFPVRHDDDELLVEEFEMLELQPRAHARTAKPHPPPRDARPRDHAPRTGRQDRPPTRLLQRPPQPANDPRQLNCRESRHDLVRQARAAPAAAQLLGARRSATRAGRPALGRHVTRDQPSGGARCVPASEPSRLLSRPVHSLRRQAERATVPGDAFESSPSYVRFLGPELRRWHGAGGAGARTSRRPRWKRCSEHGHPAITEPNAGAARRNRRAESARSSTSSTRSAAPARDRAGEGTCHRASG